MRENVVMAGVIITSEFNPSSGLNFIFVECHFVTHIPLFYSILKSFNTVMENEDVSWQERGGKSARKKIFKGIVRELCSRLCDALKFIFSDTTPSQSPSTFPFN